MRLRSACALIAVLLLADATAQAPEPKLWIASPQNGGYESGTVLIRAVLDPPSTPVEKMQFWVDGRIVNTISQPPFECTWNVGELIKAHSFRVVAFLRGGGKKTAVVNTNEMVVNERSEVRVLHVPVSVLDGSQYVRGLTRDSFRVFDDDVRQPITYFASENIPLELILGIDISSSMDDFIRDVKENVKRFRGALRPNDVVTVVGFNENFFIAAPSSMDAASQIKRIDRLGSWGMTSFYEMLRKSFDLLGRKVGRRAMVIFTDGQDTASRISADDVERRKETSDAVMYLIGQGEALKSAQLKAVCERLAKKSGGRAFFPRSMDANALRQSFDQILEELSNQYLIGFVAKTDSEWHRVRIEVDGHYEVRAMEGYRWRTKGPS